MNDIFSHVSPVKILLRKQIKNILPSPDAEEKKKQLL